MDSPFIHPVYLLKALLQGALSDFFVPVLGRQNLIFGDSFLSLHIELGIMSTVRAFQI